MRRRRLLIRCKPGKPFVRAGSERRPGRCRSRGWGGESQHDEPEERAATAALALGALVLAVAVLPVDRPRAAHCLQPRELEARAAWTAAVICSEGPESHGVVRGPAKLLFGETLDLNRAEARELEALPAIGPNRAAAIVRTRAEGFFRRPEDLERVPGIGSGIAAGLRDWVKVSGPPDVAADR